MTTFYQQVDKAWTIISPVGKTTTTYIQRMMGVGYNRAVKIIDELEKRGIVGQSDGMSPRVVQKLRKTTIAPNTTN